MSMITRAVRSAASGSSVDARPLRASVRRAAAVVGRYEPGVTGVTIGLAPASSPRGKAPAHAGIGAPRAHAAPLFRRGPVFPRCPAIARSGRRPASEPCGRSCFAQGPELVHESPAQGREGQQDAAAVRLVVALLDQALADKLAHFARDELARDL